MTNHNEENNNPEQKEEENQQDLNKKESQNQSNLSHQNSRSKHEIISIDEVLKRGNETIQKALGENKSIEFEPLNFGVKEKYYNSQLDTIMKGLWMEGKLEKIVVTIQKVEENLNESKRDPFRWKFLLPPVYIVKTIKKIFEEQLETKRFWKYLNWSPYKLPVSTIVYGISKLVSVIIILLILWLILFYPLDWWQKILGILILLIIWVGVIKFEQIITEDTIDTIAFIAIHDSICDVFQQAYKKQIDFINKTVDLSAQHKEEWAKLEAKRQKLPQEIAGMQLQSLKDYAEKRKDLGNRITTTEFEEYEKAYRQQLQLKYQSDLMDLARIVSIHKATDAAEIKMIKNKVDLQYQNEIKDKESRRFIAQSIAENMGRALVERAKTVAKDSKEMRKIEYQMKLVNGIRGDLQSGGEMAFADESLYQSVQKMMEEEVEIINP